MTSTVWQISSFTANLHLLLEHTHTHTCPTLRGGAREQTQRLKLRLIRTLNIRTGILEKVFFPRMAFILRNTFRSNITAPTARCPHGDGGIIVNSIPHFPAIPHRIESDFIQSKWDLPLKWEQMAFLTAILLNILHWRIKRISGTDMKLLGWVSETMNSS